MVAPDCGFSSQASYSPQIHLRSTAPARLPNGSARVAPGRTTTWCSAARTAPAGLVRREFAAITKAAGLGEEWAPRELRHSFVPILSAHGVRIEDISNLVGHSGTTVTETVYRHEIWPALTTGATAMDKILTKKRTRPGLPKGEPARPRLPATSPPAAQPATDRATPTKPQARRRAQPARPTHHTRLWSL